MVLVGYVRRLTQGYKMISVQHLTITTFPPGMLEEQLYSMTDS